MGFRFRRTTRLAPLCLNYRFARLWLRQGVLALDLCRYAGSKSLATTQAYVVDTG